jgi:hypothetical protein
VPADYQTKPETRLSEAIEQIRAKRRADGKWPMDWATRGRRWLDPEDGTRLPSRRTSSRALHVLKVWDSAQAQRRRAFKAASVRGHEIVCARRAWRVGGLSASIRPVQDAYRSRAAHLGPPRSDGVCPTRAPIASTTIRAPRCDRDGTSARSERSAPPSSFKRSRDCCLLATTLPASHIAQGNQHHLEILRHNAIRIAIAFLQSQVSAHQMDAGHNFGTPNVSWFNRRRQVQASRLNSTTGGPMLQSRADTDKRGEIDA